MMRTAVRFPAHRPNNILDFQQITQKVLRQTSSTAPVRVPRPRRQRRGTSAREVPQRIIKRMINRTRLTTESSILVNVKVSPCFQIRLPTGGPELSQGEWWNDSLGPSILLLPSR